MLSNILHMYTNYYAMPETKEFLVFRQNKTIGAGFSCDFKWSSRESKESNAYYCILD